MRHTETRLTSSLACLIAGFLACAWAGLVWTGCEGTSSGVDNPGVSELTISFRDAEGAALRVSGDLDVYGRDQNPAVDPEPLATVRVKATSLTNLTSEDFQRINTAIKTSATKRSAAPPGAASAIPGAAPDQAPAESLVSFNIVFRSDSRTGNLAFGFAYDPNAKAFVRHGGRLGRLDLQPKPLVRFQARVLRDSIHGDLGRVFIPGTPFQATLSDSGFVFEDLPEGIFTLRLLGGDGRIFAVKESLDTRSTGVFTPAFVPIGQIDSADTVKPAGFGVYLDSVQEAFVGVAAVLEAKVMGLESTDVRASFLWRQIHAGSPDTAFIASPTQLRTQVKFRTEGAYPIELAVTYGSRTVKDTVMLLVRKAPPPPRPRVVAPRPADSVFFGMPVKIAWEMPTRSAVTILFSASSGREWQVIANHVASIQGLSSFPWTPADSLAACTQCLIQVRQEAPDSLIAGMEGPFILIRRPLVEKL